MKGLFGCFLLRSLLLLLALSVLVLIPACSKDSMGPKDDGFTPPDLSTPDLLMAAFQKSLEDMDAELYAYLLYDGSESGRETFEPFTFHFPSGMDFWGNVLPGSWTRDDELDCMAALLGGEAGIPIAGDPMPGIQSIELDLMSAGEWEPAIGPDVYGDAYPQGTQRRSYAGSGTILLKGTMPDYYVTGFTMDDDNAFFIVPVTLDSGEGIRTEYRLWKWVNRASWGRANLEQGRGSTEHAAWAWIKMLYHGMQGLYLPYTTRDRLVENFRRAWERRDLAEYGDHILYNGDQSAPDGDPYAEFVFYFSQGEDIWGQPFPGLQAYEAELTNVGRMFSGELGHGPSGQEIPSIASIDLGLGLNQNWSDPSNPDDVEGDLYPEGTKRATYSYSITFLLEGTIPGWDITGFTLNDELEFHAIPILVNEGDGSTHVEFRLWKWRDLFPEGLRTEQSCWSIAKALYLM